MINVKTYANRRKKPAPAPWSESILPIAAFALLSTIIILINALVTNTLVPLEVPKTSSNTQTLSSRFTSTTLHKTIKHQDGTLTQESYPYTYNQKTGKPLRIKDVFRSTKTLKSLTAAKSTASLENANFSIDPVQKTLQINIAGTTQTLSIERIKSDLSYRYAKEIFNINISKDIDCSVQKCLALTFDDGPAGYTNRLLNILEESGAKATFFVQGSRAKSYSAQIKRMQKDGHDIGSHAWRHENLTLLSASSVKSNLARTNKSIKSVSGETTQFIRPPYGSHNATTRRVANSLGQRIVLWDVDPQDWKTKNSRSICNHVVSRAAKNRIILLHDIYKTSVDSVPCILDRLADKYVFVNLSTLYK